jgi:hypothetical protein
MALCENGWVGSAVMEACKSGGERDGLVLSAVRRSPSVLGLGLGSEVSVGGRCRRLRAS